MPDRDREKKSPHQGSGSQGQSAHGQHGEDRPRDSKGHFTSEDSPTKAGSGTKSDEEGSENEDEG